MDLRNDDCDLQSLTRLYSLFHSLVNNEPIPQPLVFDENTLFLAKRLLDSATKEILDHQNKNLPSFSSSRVGGTTKNLSGKNSSIVGLRKDIADSMEHIDTHLSASFPYRGTSLSEEALSENGQMFQDSMPCSSSNGSVPVQVSPQDQSQGHLPLPPRSIGSMKPSLRKSLEKMCIKPASLDQESEFSDQDSIEYESGSTRSSSRIRSYRSSSVESRSYSDSSRDSNQESDIGSYSSDSQHSHDYVGDGGYEESDSPPRRRRRDKSKSLLKQGKKAGKMAGKKAGKMAGKMAVGGFKRLTTELGQVFHHRDHHHKKHKEKEQESRARAITATHKRKEGKRKEGGELKALVQGMMKHKKESKKPKMLQQKHGNKTRWLLNGKGKGSFKLRNKVRVEFGKRNLLRVKDKELEDHHDHHHKPPSNQHDDHNAHHHKPPSNQHDDHNAHQHKPPSNLHDDHHDHHHKQTITATTMNLKRISL